MPRRNPVADLRSEESLARRIADEREKRGWSYEGLAKRMTDAGCPVNASGLYKIEKVEPRRRITVNELVALSEVFKVPVADLLLPPEAIEHRQLAVYAFRLRDAWADLMSATTDVEAALTDIAAYYEQHPEVGGTPLGDFQLDEPTKMLEALRGLFGSERT